MRRLVLLVMFPAVLCLGCNERQREASPPSGAPVVGLGSQPSNASRLYDGNLEQLRVVDGADALACTAPPEPPGPGTAACPTLCTFAEVSNVRSVDTAPTLVVNAGDRTSIVMQQPVQLGSNPAFAVTEADGDSFWYRCGISVQCSLAFGGAVIDVTVTGDPQVLVDGPSPGPAVPQLWTQNFNFNMQDVTFA